MRLLIRGAGPAGAFLALRAHARGWSVSLTDPFFEDATSHLSAPGFSTMQLPLWPATYGVLSPEVPAWAEQFFYQEHPMTVTFPHSDTNSGKKIKKSLPVPYTYRILDKKSLREKIEEYAQYGDISFLAPSHLDEDSYDAIVHCTGAPQDNAPFYQIAVGYLFSENSLSDIPHVRKATFMDWTPGPCLNENFANNTSAFPPSFLYVQPVEGGWLYEETILAVNTPKTEHGHYMNLLEERLKSRLYAWGLDQPFIDHNIFKTEKVSIPLGSYRGRWWRRYGKVYFFGSAAGLINPATGYSLGASMHLCDPFLDGLSLTHPKKKNIFHWKIRYQAWLAWNLRYVGAKLISEGQHSTLQDFFIHFFNLPAQNQRDYLVGHNGYSVARTMWRMRQGTGFIHPFLRPLYSRKFWFK